MTPRRSPLARVVRARAGLVTLGGRRSAPGRRPPEVEVITRVGCGSCALAERLAVQEAGDAVVRTRDVDADEADVRRYGVLVPVVLVDGRPVAELQVMAGEIARALRAARRGRALGR